MPRQPRDGRQLDGRRQRSAQHLCNNVDRCGYRQTYVAQKEQRAGLASSAGLSLCEVPEIAAVKRQFNISMSWPTVQSRKDNKSRMCSEISRTTV
jgi:hypothetical protein